MRAVWISTVITKIMIIGTGFMCAKNYIVKYSLENHIYWKKDLFLNCSTFLSIEYINNIYAKCIPNLTFCVHPTHSIVNITLRFKDRGKSTLWAFILIISYNYRPRNITHSIAQNRSIILLWIKIWSTFFIVTHFKLFKSGNHTKYSVKIVKYITKTVICKKI